MRYDAGLAASPPVRDILGVARRKNSPSSPVRCGRTAFSHQRLDPSPIASLISAEYVTHTSAITSTDLGDMP